MSFDSKTAQALQDIFEECGEEATFTPATGDPVTGIYVDVNESTILAPGTYQAGLSLQDKTIEYIVADIGREVKNGETFTVNSTVYTVVQKVSCDGYTGIVAVK